MALTYDPPTHVSIDYVDDDGNHHTISQKQSVQVAAGNTVATGNNPAFSHRNARHVGLRYIDGGGKVYRKRVIIGSTANPAWKASATTMGTIDGVTWTIEGRMGERRIPGQ